MYAYAFKFFNDISRYVSLIEKNENLKIILKMKIL